MWENDALGKLPVRKSKTNHETVGQK